MSGAQISSRGKSSTSEQLQVPAVTKERETDLSKSLQVLETANKDLVARGQKASAPFISEITKHTQDLSKFNPKSLPNEALVRLRDAGNVSLSNLRVLGTDEALRSDVTAKIIAVQNAYQSATSRTPAEEQAVNKAIGVPVGMYKQIGHEVDAKNGPIAVITSAADKELAGRGVANRPAVAETNAAKPNGSRAPLASSSLDASIGELKKATDQLAGKASTASQPFFAEVAKQGQRLETLDVSKLSNDALLNIRDAGNESLSRLKVVGQEPAMRSDLEAKIQAVKTAQSKGDISKADEQRSNNAINVPIRMYQQIHEEVDNRRGPIGVVTAAAERQIKERGERQVPTVQPSVRNNEVGSQVRGDAPNVPVQPESGWNGFGFNDK